VIVLGEVRTDHEQAGQVNFAGGDGAENRGESTNELRGGGTASGSVLGKA
jgi:hypothetical protein